MSDQQRFRSGLAWLTLALAFGALYSGAALILFPFVYSGEE